MLILMKKMAKITMGVFRQNRLRNKAAKLKLPKTITQALANHNLFFILIKTSNI